MAMHEARLGLTASAAGPALFLRLHFFSIAAKRATRRQHITSGARRKLRYLTEILTAWRPLLAATLGMGTGMSVLGTVTSAIAPTLIADAGWNEAEFALIGTISLLTVLAMPFIGRLADVLGVRLTAGIGIVTLPLAFLAYSFTNGSLIAFVSVFVVQSLICVTTTATVYTRLVMQSVQHSRGLALAIVACGPALFSAIGGPVLNSFVEANGWVASYRAVALFTAIAGAIVLLLIPSSRKDPTAVRQPARRARDDYPEIFRSPAFWILLGAMLLCNLPQTLILVQLKMLALDNGVSGEDASIMFTALAVGMLVGRFATGIALDRIAPHIVSCVTLALPSLGLFVLASDFDALWVITFSIFCLGFAVGAEGDIVAFLVGRHFRVAIYSSVMGLMTAAIAFSASSGAGYLSWTLARTGNFDMFLITAGIGVLLGAALLLLLGGHDPKKATPAPA